ncbi:MAG: entericidin A/B family lipoprotein [Nitrosomonadales bacterium]|nr:entericidin A/B family lipoprotein [Nitrosomonadales bacterium]
MKKIFVLLLVAGVLAGCNTLQGVGKDIQKGGAAIEKAANK